MIPQIINKHPVTEILLQWGPSSSYKNQCITIFTYITLHFKTKTHVLLLEKVNNSKNSQGLGVHIMVAGLWITFQCGVFLIIDSKNDFCHQGIWNVLYQDTGNKCFIALYNGKQRGYFSNFPWLKHISLTSECYSIHWIIKAD